MIIYIQSLFREKIDYYTGRPKLLLILVWLSWLVQRVLSSMSDPTDDLNLI